MDYVLAKVKRLRKNPVFKLISNHTLFEKIDIDQAAYINYSPDHNLDDDSWFRVEKFSEQDYCPEKIKGDFDIKNYNDLTKEKFSEISHICAVQGEDFYFQKVAPSLFLKRKIIAFGEIAEVEKNNPRLVINNQPDAIYFSNIDTLAFRNLATISSIFPGIDELYKEATQEEVKNFLAEPFIALSNNFKEENVSKPNRKRIALAMETLASLPEEHKDAMLSYIDGYCGEKIKLDKKTGKFEISTDNDLKLLIYGIEQRFYTTQFGKEKRLANSVQTLD